ncbi:MAG: efflux RND transporter periplasmic adaptor subunit [Candidatus Eremiobacteraeota bacterium]|nr:efflux RND transporter periplasmic adaptor subunit [Candidatus Eremiobacteraeota bacterium]
MKPLLFFVVAALIVATSACARKGGYPGGGGPGGGGFAFPVAAAPLTRGGISAYTSTTGSVVPRLTGSLSSVASGTVLSVGAQIGERVQKGQLLVQIDDSTLRAQEAQAAANYDQQRASAQGGTSTAQANLRSAQVANNNAQLTLQRNRTLYSQGYVSKAALDDATNAAATAQAQLASAQVAAQNASLSSQNSAAVAQLQAAQAALATVQRQIAQTRVSAPFDGVVTARNVDPGSLAAPGTVLMEVSQLDPVYIDTTIAGSDLGFVHVGTPVNVTVAGVDGRTWHGTIRYLNLAADPGTSVYKARIPISNPDFTLRGGMVANVQYAQAHKNNVLLAPRAAVYQTPAGYGMFIIDQGKAKQVDVNVGIENDQVAEVSGPGLKPGVQAILNHSVLLQPGTPVQVLPPQPSGPKQTANR